MSDDVLRTIMDPRTPFDERRVAVLTFTRDTWLKGWDECDAAYRQALAEAAIVFDFSTVKPRHPEGRA